ncbi:heme-binding domain-containing protein [Aquiflexum sp.]|uniref:heme-binding domain-containing protein n=1 Tax=Aquiflexum sp. TaxID=1872584 RepID=UPI003594524F
MKKIFFLPALAIIGFLFFQGITKPEPKTEFISHEIAPDMPPQVKAIVEQKCYGCHNAESKNEKGKKKLDWDAFEASKRAKQIAAKGKILEVLENGDMPPAKFLENKPEGKLTEEEVATLMAWSKSKKN